MTIAASGSKVDGTSDGSGVVTFTFTATAGNQIAGYVFWKGNTVTFSTATCSGNTVNIIGSPFYDASTNESIQFFTINNLASSGSNSVVCTLTGGAGSNCNGSMQQFTGGNTTGFYNSSSLATASGNSATLSVNVNPSVDNCAIMAAGVSAFGGGPAASGSGYVGMSSPGNFWAYNAGEYNVDVGSAGSRAVQMTSTDSATWSIAAIALEIAGGSDTGRTPSAGSLLLTGVAPIVSMGIGRVPSVGAITISGLGPSVTQQLSITSSVVSLALAGNTPSVTQQIYSTPLVGSMTISGKQATVQVGASVTITPTVGALAFTGYTVTQDLTVPAPGTGLILSSTIAPVVTQQFYRTPNIGSIALSGAAPTVTQQIYLAPTVGAVVVSGNTPSIQANGNMSISPGTGSLSLDGTAPSLGNQVTITPSAGVMTVTGIAPAVTQGTVISPSVGALSLSGKQVSLMTAFTITPNTGAVTIAGGAASLLTDYRLSPTVGSLTLSGKQVTVASANPNISPGTGALSFSGNSPTVLASGLRTGVSSYVIGGAGVSGPNVSGPSVSN